MKQITFEHEGRNYTLEFTKNSVRQMERRGFVIDEIASKPMTVIPNLFAGAFLSKHPQMKREKIDELYEAFGDKQLLVRALVDMYSETIEGLLDESDAGNVTWTPNFKVSEA